MTESAQLAIDLLDALDMREPADIHVGRVAELCGAEIATLPMSTRDGYVLRTADRTMIAVREGASIVQYRFVVAHEIGHIVEGDMPAGEECERQASEFASELLLPEPMLQRCVPRDRFGLDLIRDTAIRFRTSLTAAALRLVAYTDVPAFVSLESRGATKHKHSRTFGTLEALTPATIEIGRTTRLTIAS